MRLTDAKLEPVVILTKDNPNVTLTGELWDVFCEDLGENRPRYNGTALYIVWWEWIQYQACVMIEHVAPTSIAGTSVLVVP